MGDKQGSCGDIKRSFNSPTYDLATIQQMVLSNNHRITSSAIQSAAELGFTDDNIIEAISLLKPIHFYKTMEAMKNQGRWQDVYHLLYQGVKIYLKVQIDGCAVVISFKEVGVFNFHY